MYSAGLGLCAGCGSAVAARPAAIDGLTQIAKARYNHEANGVTVHRKLNRAAADQALLSALRGNDLPALRRAAQHEQIGTHQHISCLRVLRGSQVLARFGGTVSSSRHCQSRLEPACRTAAPSRSAATVTR
jgi:hypothetical protein